MNLASAVYDPLRYLEALRCHRYTYSIQRHGRAKRNPTTIYDHTTPTASTLTKTRPRPRSQSSASPSELVRLRTSANIYPDTQPNSQTRLSPICHAPYCHLHHSSRPRLLLTNQAGQGPSLAEPEPSLRRPPSDKQFRSLVLELGHGRTQSSKGECNLTRSEI